MTGINKYLKYFGIEIRKLNLNVYRFKQKYLLDKNKITNLLDVGASGGLYGKLVRSYGYSGNIFSFEPVKKSYDILAKSAANDTSWYCYNYALGSND